MTSPSDTTHHEIQALLGPDTAFEGTLKFRGRVRIDGYVRGQVSGDDILILGERGKVEGDVEVATLIVRGGSVLGNVRASRVIEIHAPGSIIGDITSPQVFIDRGVIFDGRCNMNDETVVRSLEDGEPVGVGSE